jgi:Rab GDP dissociation inhibitor
MAVCKVPADDMEALKSNLMGLFEKKRVVNLYKFINNVDLNDPKTWNNMNLKKQPMKDIFKHYDIEESKIDFLGHAVALHYQDNYLHEPAIDTI